MNNYHTQFSKGHLCRLGAATLWSGFVTTKRVWCSTKLNISLQLFTDVIVSRSLMMQEVCFKMISSHVLMFTELRVFSLILMFLKSSSQNVIDCFRLWKFYKL